MLFLAMFKKSRRGGVYDRGLMLSTAMHTVERPLQGSVFTPISVYIVIWVHPDVRVYPDIRVCPDIWIYSDIKECVIRVHPDIGEYSDIGVFFLISGVYPDISVIGMTA